MYYNNKGSVLIFTLIVFSIVSTITMMCIGLNYSNSRISNLNYKSIVMRESLLSSIELVHSNILKEVSIAIENSENQEQFKNYFLGNTFVNNIKNISNSQIQNVTVKIPGKITYNSSGLITFQIETTFKEDNYTKKYRASIDIDTNLNFNDASNELKNESETLNENYSNNFTNIYKINYEEKYTELKNDEIHSLDNNISDNYDNKPENYYKDNIKSINPSSIVKVYDYKEI